MDRDLELLIIENETVMQLKNLIANHEENDAEFVGLLF